MDTISTQTTLAYSHKRLLSINHGKPTQPTTSITVQGPHTPFHACTPREHAREYDNAHIRALDHRHHRLGNKAVVGWGVDGAVHVGEADELERRRLDAGDERASGADELGVDDGVERAHVIEPDGADARGAGG